MMDGENYVHQYANPDRTRKVLSSIVLEHNRHPIVRLNFTNENEFLMIAACFDPPKIRKPEAYDFLEEDRFNEEAYRKSWDEYDARMHEAFKTIKIKGYRIEEVSHSIWDSCGFDMAPKMYSLDETTLIVERVASFFFERRYGFLSRFCRFAFG